MSDQTWNRLLAGGLLWALVGFFPIIVFILGAVFLLWVIRVALFIAAAIWLLASRLVRA